MSDLITVPESAHILRRNRSAIHQLVKDGGLKPASKASGPTGPYLFHRSDIEQLAAKRIASSTVEGRNELMRERLERGATVTASGCHEWTGFTTPAGYGRIKFKGSHTLTHRIAWELAFGPIAEGMCVLHHCDNPPCMNLSHLFIGTQLENIADRHAKGRTFNGSAALTHCRAGHPYGEGNTALVDGHRECLTCRAGGRARGAVRRSQKRAAAREAKASA